MGGLERRKNPKHDFILMPCHGSGSCQHLYRITDAGRARLVVSGIRSAIPPEADVFEVC